MLSFRGHFVTKSRGYSTNLGELRATRAAYRARQNEPPDDANDDDSTVVLSVWQYLGSGYLNPATCSWQLASRHPYGPPVKRCSICVAGHRKRARPYSLTSGLLIRSSPGVAAGHDGLARRALRRQRLSPFARSANLASSNRPLF
jgi:hypothetical protein